MFWLETWWIYSFCWVGWISQSTFPGLRRRWVTHPPWDILPLRWPPRELGPANRRTPKAPWLLPCLDCPSQQTTDLQLFTSINKTTFATRLLLKPYGIIKRIYVKVTFSTCLMFFGCSLDVHWMFFRCSLVVLLAFFYCYYPSKTATISQIQIT